MYFGNFQQVVAKFQELMIDFGTRKISSRDLQRVLIKFLKFKPYPICHISKVPACSGQIYSLMLRNKK